MELISNILVVSKISNVPEYARPVERAGHPGHPCCIVNGSLLRRTRRYICLSYEETGFVVCDVRILHQNEVSGDDFSEVLVTHDTCERAFKKKRLCVKLVPLHAAPRLLRSMCLVNLHLGDCCPQYYTVSELSFSSFLICCSFSFPDYSSLLPGKIHSILPFSTPTVDDVESPKPHKEPQAIQLQKHEGNCNVRWLKLKIPPQMSTTSVERSFSVQNIVTLRKNGIQLKALSYEFELEKSLLGRK